LAPTFTECAAKGTVFKQNAVASTTDKICYYLSCDATNYPSLHAPEIPCHLFFTVSTATWGAGQQTGQTGLGYSIVTDPDSDLIRMRYGASTTDKAVFVNPFAAGPLAVAFNLKAPLAVTGGRILVKDSAPALYEYSLKLKSHSAAALGSVEEARESHVCSPAEASNVVFHEKLTTHAGACFKSYPTSRSTMYFAAQGISPCEVVMTFASLTRITTATITAQREKYQPAYDVYENGVLVVSDDTAPGSGEASHTKTLTWSSVPLKYSAPALALYGSNDAGQNWTRVASLDVISAARNYGGGAHDVFGAAPVGSHVYRFVANINGSSSSVPQIGDVSAYLADGTDMVFLASELTFLKPLASAATGAAAMTADTTFAALAGPVVDGDGLFSLTTDKPIHKFNVQLKFEASLVVSVYRDDVLVSSATEATAVVVDGAISFTHRVSHFLAVVGSGTSPAVSEF
jgi:hypothetical protein